MTVKHRSLLPAFGYGVVMFFGYSLPGKHIERFQKSNELSSLAFSDTALHILGFGIFTALLCYGMSEGGKIPLPYPKITLIAVGYGLFLEIWQAFLPWRSFRIKDLAFNTIGTLSVLIIWGFLKGRQKPSAGEN